MGNVLSFLPSLSLARSTVVPTASNLPFLHSPGSSSLPPLAKSGEPERQSHRRTWTSELITPVDQEFAIRKAKLSINVHFKRFSRWYRLLYNDSKIHIYRVIAHK
ncbi:hypothetical protein F5880DRAFT_1518610 [Lentinula raphanica]|nr:hypothetical protein F5880DRAFT_1518610 [Lentinula raphanica]